MKISELKKRDDFPELVEISRKMVQSYEDYDYMKMILENRLELGLSDKPMAMGRRIYGWAENHPDEQEVAK